MNIVKIVNGKVELRTDKGSLVKNITDKAISAALNDEQNLVVITKLDGKVELRDSGGSLKKGNITDNATDARFAGADIAVTKKNGKVEIRSISGSLKKVI